MFTHPGLHACCKARPHCCMGGRTSRKDPLGRLAQRQQLVQRALNIPPVPQAILCTTVRLLGAHAPAAPCVLLSPAPQLQGGRTSRKDPLGRIAQRQQLVQRTLHARAARAALLHIRQPSAAARGRRPGARRTHSIRRSMATSLSTQYDILLQLMPVKRSSLLCLVKKLTCPCSSKICIFESAGAC